MEKKRKIIIECFFGGRGLALDASSSVGHGMGCSGGLREARGMLHAGFLKMVMGCCGDLIPLGSHGMVHVGEGGVLEWVMGCCGRS